MHARIANPLCREKTLLAFTAHAQPAIWRISQEAHKINFGYYFPDYIITTHDKILCIRTLVSHNISNKPMGVCIKYVQQCLLRNTFHSADSSIVFPDLHTIQTRASEVHPSVVNDWPPACLHKIPPRGHQRGNWRNPRGFQLNQYMSYKPHSCFNLHGNFWRFCFCPLFLTWIKNLCWYWGSTAQIRSILWIKNIGHPKVNRGCPLLTANCTSTVCMEITPGPSVHHIPIRVYHTGGFSDMSEIRKDINIMITTLTNLKLYGLLWDMALK